MTHRRPKFAPPARMGDAQFAATVLELRRVVLGGRPDRPELQPTRAELVTYQREKNFTQRFILPKRQHRHQSR